MRLRDRRAFEKPEVMIIPMIDIMFFLLVFFIMSTLYMVNLKTVDVNLPKAQTAQTAQTQLNVTYLVTVRKDGSLWLEDQQIDEATLLRRARAESQKNQRFAVVVRADGDMNYSGVMELLDKFRKEGITRFGLAAQ
jgi:hypothetical protein